MTEPTVRVGVFPGSFDPFTTGHGQVVEQALQLFDRVIVAIGRSGSKQPLLTSEDRLAALGELYHGEPRISVCAFSGLIVDFAQEVGAGFLIRGLRSESDLAYELPMAHTNRALRPSLRTIFFPTAPELAFISSTLVREIALRGGDYTSFVPQVVAQRIQQHMTKA